MLQYITMGKKPKRVAIFADFLNEIGGVEYYINQLALSLKSAEVDVRVYCGVEPENKYWINLLKKHDIKTTFSKLHYKDRKDRTPEKTLTQQLVKDFNKWKPDIIHSCPMGKLVKIWLETPNRQSIPIVATEMTTPGPDTKHWYSNDLFEKINKFDAIIAWSQASSRGIKRFLGYEGEVVIFPHFIPAPKKKIDFISKNDAKNKSIGCISRLSPEKGIDYLIAAMSFVVKKTSNSTAHIYGMGRDEERLKYLVKCFGLENNIFFEGIYEPIVGIDNVSQKHNIFVQPSLFEGMSIAMLELMVRKRAIIATKVGGNLELFSKSRSGILVDRGDTKALANKILFLLDNIENQMILSKKAYSAFQERYKQINVLNSHIELYNKYI